ncbi:uncharacterized protein LOC103383726 [Cynoglossus semilaevis]|uniref:uncharacterized protein LOC103383726 n=1 Tax=Cynoglossus semilaevis TaxID=244447 RepID=UPI00049521BA|nr:uncharacterized protein LOC103383726 [Cynoglossus semilaevis]
MGKPLSRPGCFRKSSCCLEKHGVGDGRLGRRDGGMEGGYGDGYIPQRSIYDTMCINQQIDSHHHPGGSVRRDCGMEGNLSYSASGSLRVCRSPVEMFDSQPCSLTPNPSFVRRLDERAIYDSLKLGGQDVDGSGFHSPDHFTRSASPSVSSFSAPGVSSLSKKNHHHHHHHHHGDSTKSRDGRHSWKVMTPPKPLKRMEISNNEMMDRGGGGYLNPGHYPPPGGQTSSLTSPLISPFSGSPISSGYHTPVFFSPVKHRPSQSQSLRCSPPHVIQQRHYSQTQSLRLSPPHELRRSPFQAPLVQLSAHDLEQDLRDQGGGWGRSEREREWEREREREMERGWAQREWERERERGRLERERARERERRETFFGTFGYVRPVPLHSDRDSVFLDPDQGLDTTPLLLPQPSPSPSPNAAPRMGTCAVGRNRAGSKVGHESSGGGMVSKFDNGSVGLVLVDSKSGCGPRLVSEGGVAHMSEAEMRAGLQAHHRAESRNKYDRGSRVSVKNGSESRVAPQVKTRPEGQDRGEKVHSGIDPGNMVLSVHEVKRGEATSEAKSQGDVAKEECITESTPPILKDRRHSIGARKEYDTEADRGNKPITGAGLEAPGSSTQTGRNNGSLAKDNKEVHLEAEFKESDKSQTDVSVGAEFQAEKDTGFQNDTRKNTETNNVAVSQQCIKASDKIVSSDVNEIVPKEQVDEKASNGLKKKSSHTKKSSKSHKSKSSKSCSRSRPGTATGLQPGVSPKIRRDLESPGPFEGTESTWPRRIMVRKRTVRQGGALHNLPVLPPLPSVLSALEKRRPQSLIRAGHSPNPQADVKTASSIVGRCSLKEPSNTESAQAAGFVGRASLKEQNLEHWRVCRDHEDSRTPQNTEKNEEQRKKSRRNEQNGEEDKENQKVEERDKIQHFVVENIENILVCEELLEKTSQENEEIFKSNDKTPKGLKGNDEVMSEKLDSTSEEIEDATLERHEQQLVLVALQRDGCEEEGREVGRMGDQAGMESWDSVLEMVNTLWDEGWQKGGQRDEGDTDSCSGSLQRWPLLRPPVGFGGSHPPSSAASELSLTELERRARELDSDLEHLDLSQPLRDNQDLHKTLLDPKRERADIYQTHPGPQREKAAILTGVGSRSQVSLELTAMTSPSTKIERTSPDWSSQGTGTSNYGTSSTKEDSSPDSNITLESDSSGIFLSLSNQSQEDAGSDSDQPVSGSDLGSSTSLEKDGAEGGLKEWGREESAELQWCYPSLLNTSPNDDTGFVEREQTECGTTDRDDEREDTTDGRTDGKIGIVSITKSSVSLTDFGGCRSLSVQQRKKTSPRKRVALKEDESSLMLSPLEESAKQLLDLKQKPIRSSGLDCGDIDPFVQSDSFVYLAVSAGPDSQGAVTEFGHRNTKAGTIHTRLDETKPHVGSVTTQLDPTTVDKAAKLAHLTPQKPEEGDFLCTDSFVYLAAPACLLLGPQGTTPYSGRDSDSESSGSGPVDVSVLGCDSDWDSDLSDSDPSRCSRLSGIKSAAVSQPQRDPAEPDWDMYGEVTEAEVPTELFTQQDRNNDSRARTVTKVTTCMAATPDDAMATQPTTTQVKLSSAAEPSTTTKKVTWQFKPAQRSVCTGSRKEKEKEFTPSSSYGRFNEMGGDEMPRSRHSPSSSSSSSPSSSSSSG